MSVNEKMTAIAQTIRDKTGGTELLTLDGMAVGVDEVFLAGEKKGHDRFWDSYQDNGSREDYSTAFAGEGWTEDLFKPKYDMRPYSSYMMFRDSRISTDLPKLLERLGVVLDFSQAQNTQYLFYMSRFTHIGVVDFSGATNTVPMEMSFGNCAELVTIDKIIIGTGKSGQFSNTFNYCAALKNVTFEGLIIHNGLSLQWSTRLSRASIESVVNALSATTSGLSMTFSKTAVNTAFETTGGASDGSSSAEWAGLANTKSNWTINLI